MKLQPPIYRARLLTCDKSDDIVFDDSIIIPLDAWSARIFVADPKCPIKGPIAQHRYTGRRIKLRSIVYLIGLSGLGEEIVNTDSPDVLRAGYTDHYDEVFEHRFKDGVYFEQSTIQAEANSPLYKEFTVGAVFPMIRTNQAIPILQFVA